MNEKKKIYYKNYNFFFLKIISKNYQNYINFCQNFKYIVSYIIAQMLYKLSIVATFS